MAENIRSTKIFHKDAHSNCILAVMNQLRKNSLLCDVTLVTGDAEIPAHKTILVASSHYFYIILTNHKKNYENKVTLKGIDSQTLRAIIEYIYTSEVKITQENVQIDGCLFMRSIYTCISTSKNKKKYITDILVAANLLQIDDLRDFCIEFLTDSLNSTNCLEIWTNAKLHDFEYLFKDAEDFILDNFTDVRKSQAFLQLSDGEVSEIISKDELLAFSEAEVFDSVLTWTKHNLELRQRHFVALMKNVRIYWLPKQYMNDIFLEEPLLKNDPECKDFIIEALKCLIPDGHAKMTTTKRRKCLPKEYSKILLVAGGVESMRSVEYFCFKKKAWSELADMPIDRNGACATVLNGKVYIAGGCNENRVDIYDAAADRWIPSVNMEFERFHLDVTSLKNCIYAVGGYINRSLNTVEKFDPETKQWSTVAPMLSKRFFHRVGVIDDILYAVGGHDSINCLNSVESYNPTTNTWTYVKSMDSKRCHVGVGVLNGMLYAVGGFDGSCLKSAEVFDPKTGNWAKIKDMHNCRKDAAVVAANDLLYVIGGSYKSQQLTSVEVYDPKTMTWSVLPSCMNVGRGEHCAVILDKFI